MFYQPGIRIQRPKGYKVKQGLQVALIVVFLIWVLYQIKLSYDKKKGQGGNPENFTGSERTDILLGHHSKATKEKQNEKSSSDKQTIDKDAAKAASSAEEKEAMVNVPGRLQNVPGQGEPLRGISSFPDENGVPQDGHEFVNFHLMKKRKRTVKDSVATEAATEGETRLASWDIVNKSIVKATSETTRANAKFLTLQHDKKAITDLKIPAKTRNGARAKRKFDAAVRIKGV